MINTKYKLEVAELMRAVDRHNASGHFAWIGSDGWSARGLVTQGWSQNSHGFCFLVFFCFFLLFSLILFFLFFCLPGSDLMGGVQGGLSLKVGLDTVFAFVVFVFAAFVLLLLLLALIRSNRVLGCLQSVFFWYYYDILSKI